jgi:nucleotide-binding universal stress UspA family protein
MPRYKYIMVAVDFSEHSLASFRHAAALASDLGARLLLVNVIHQRDVDMMKRVAEQAPQFSFETHLKETVAERESFFRELVKASPAGNLDIATKVCIGYPFAELLKVIEKKKPDLLVMGVKGRSNLVETVIGSCAQKMFRRCPVPLLVIR